MGVQTVMTVGMLLLGGLPGIVGPEPPDGATASLSPDEFVASCIDISDAADADTSTASLCRGSIERAQLGTVTTIRDGMTSGTQPVLAPGRDEVAIVAGDEVVVVGVDGEDRLSVEFPDVASLAWGDGEVIALQLTDETWSVVGISRDDGAIRDIASDDLASPAIEQTLAVDPSGTWALLARGSELLRLELADGAVSSLFEFDADWVYGGDISNDGSMIAFVKDRGITVIDAATGEMIGEVRWQNQVVTPTFAPDDSGLLYVEGSASLRLAPIADLDAEIPTTIYDLPRFDDDPTTFPAFPAWS